MHLFSIHYLPQINYLKALLNADEIKFEMEEHFQRQTYRNRCEIYTADGMHKLVVPIDHSQSKEGRSRMRDVRIAYADNWQLQHKRTIQSAYQSSSYYEYFEAEFNTLFDKKYHFLVDFNLAALEMIHSFLKLPLQFSMTNEYFRTPKDMIDSRETFTINNHEVKKEYYQVFQTKKGFIGNLSSIDLLFNLGPKGLLEYIK